MTSISKRDHELRFDSPQNQMKRFRNSFSSDSSGASGSDQPNADRPRSSFAAAFDLQSELQREVESSTPESSSSFSGQEQPCSAGPRWEPTRTPRWWRSYCWACWREGRPRENQNQDCARKTVRLCCIKMRGFLKGLLGSLLLDRNQHNMILISMKERKENIHLKMYKNVQNPEKQQCSTLHVINAFLFVSCSHQGTDWINWLRCGPLHTCPPNPRL